MHQNNVTIELHHTKHVNRERKHKQTFLSLVRPTDKTEHSVMLLSCSPSVTNQHFPILWNSIHEESNAEVTFQMSSFLLFLSPLS